MKNYLLLAVASIFLTMPALGQTAQPAAASAINPETSKAKAAAEAPFTREKFDPTRDPKADLAAAVATATKTGKNIVLDVGGEWCGWCVFMDKFFFQHPELSKARSDAFVWVKVNYSKENENKEFLSAYPEPAGYPHLFVLDPSGKLIQSQDTSALEMGKGYDPAKFAEFLKKWSPDSAGVTGVTAPIKVPAH